MGHTRTTGAFLLLAALWGTSFVATRAGLPDIPPVLFAALRFDAAGLLMLAYAAWSAGPWRPRTRADWLAAGVGGLFFVAVHHALLFVGQQYVTSAVAAVVISLDPVLAAAFAYLLLPDERLSPLGVVGLLFGLVGVAVIAAPDAESVAGADPIGVVLVLLAAAAFALGAVLTRRYRTDAPVATMQAWMMLLGAPLLHGASFAAGETPGDVNWTPVALLSLGYLVVVAGCLGYLLYFALLDRLGAVEINLVAYATPVFAALGGRLLLGEALAPSTAVGFLAILVGFVLVKRRALATAVAARSTGR